MSFRSLPYCHRLDLPVLEYSDQAKKIKNYAVKNEDANSRLIRELKEELAELRHRISGTRESIFDPTISLGQQLVTYRTKDGEPKTITQAELQDQFEASERLMNDLNQTWEEKLERSRCQRLEREAALEAMGILVEKDFIGIHTPKKVGPIHLGITAYVSLTIVSDRCHIL